MAGLRANSDVALYGGYLVAAPTYVFTVLFGLSTLMHIWQAYRHRLFFMYFTIVVGGLLEILGWAGRLWSTVDRTLLNPYLMQICCLILGPAFLMAANYLMLGLIIQKLGPQYSRLLPTWYTIIFCLGDLASLIIQAVGGARAALAVQSRAIPRPDPNVGARIMVAGVIVQMVVMVAFTIIAAEFIIRWKKDLPFKGKAHLAETKPVSTGEPLSALDEASERTRWKILLGALSASTLLIFIRSVYRTIELLEGWTGPIISNQALFSTLDGAMVFLSIVIFNFFHPGRLLRTRENPIKFHSLRPKRQARRDAEKAQALELQATEVEKR